MTGYTLPDAHTKAKGFLFVKTDLNFKVDTPQ